MGFLSFLKRPFVGDQTTGRLAYQRSHEYTCVGYTGDAGFHVLRSMNATSPAGIVPGPSHKLNDPSVTGNVSDTVGVTSLSDPRSF